MVTAKLTDDASNVWRRADGTWSNDLQQAGLVDDAATAKALVAALASEQRLITDPYAFEVHASDGAIDPLTARERIRASGPTVRVRRPDHELGR